MERDEVEKSVPRESAKRYIGIDLGDKRTGLALGDSITRLATPVKVLEIPISQDQGEALLDALKKEIDALVGKSACDLVLGLALNMDGSEGPRAKLARAWGERLAATTARAVHFQDERLSSVDADWQMAQSGLTHKQKKERRDAIAAAGILGDFLRELSAT
jgi:putative Holliday junction resolvase